MFTKTAKHYDTVYSDKDYEKEVEVLTSLIDARQPDAITLLDVACGTGKHLELLAQQYECSGVDLDSEMLAVASERVPNVCLYRQDMTALNIDQQFDVVTCLFSSIGYTKTVERMNKSVENMANQLAPSGLLFVEPWITPESWLVGKAHSDTVETEEFIVTRMMVAEPVERGRVVFEYLIGDSSGINRVTETHEMGWFTHDEYMSAFESAGLTVEFDDPGLFGRGMYIGTKQARI
jgi:ubiquinone/menaquinone biosynthesis C-methylase UbiE